MEPVAVVLDPEHNPDRFTVRIGKTMEWDTIANQIVDLQVSVRPALRATESSEFSSLHVLGRVTSLLFTRL
jgi:hypothetical protein